MNTIESKQAINKPGAEMLPLYGRGIYLNSAGSTTIDIPFTDDIDIETRVNFWLLQAVERANNKAVADQDINAEKINRLNASRAALNQARQKSPVKEITPMYSSYTSDYYKPCKPRVNPLKTVLKTIALIPAFIIPAIIVIYPCVIFIKALLY